MLDHVPQISWFMAAIMVPTLIGDGQFDDAPEGLQDAHASYAYIHTDPKINSNDCFHLSDSSEEEEYDSEEIDETYDDNRVEDEDWENVERG